MNNSFKRDVHAIYSKHIISYRFSDSTESILPQALFLSRMFEAKLHILHVATSSGLLLDGGDTMCMPVDDPGTLSRLNEDLYKQNPELFRKMNYIKG